MRKILVVVDMQNDFIDGALGTKEAEAILDNVAEKIKEYNPKDVFYTMDTHEENYMETQEGKFLPVEHCIERTEGWKLNKRLEPLLAMANMVVKPTFGSMRLGDLIEDIYEEEDGNIEIELIGLCTDICVISRSESSAASNFTGSPASRRCLPEPEESSSATPRTSTRTSRSNSAPGTVHCSAPNTTSRRPIF